MPPSKKTFHTLFRPLSADARARRGALDIEDDPSLQAIWEVIARVPRGKVSTYGEVARAAGLPGRARQAGYALRHMPEGLNLPWHRILGAGGKIVFPPRSRQHREQARLLRSEGVEVTKGRVPRTAIATLDEI
jgi:methylated-DNA-protein-cysteine methyltransferase related protein